jgi:sRNA-binding protein
MTSDGEVRYVACVDCGARRVDVRGTPAMPAGALSREVLR